MIQVEGIDAIDKLNAAIYFAVGALGLLILLLIIGFASGFLQKTSKMIGGELKEIKKEQDLDELSWHYRLLNSTILLSFMMMTAMLFIGMIIPLIVSTFVFFITLIIRIKLKSN